MGRMAGSPVPGAVWAPPKRSFGVLGGMSFQCCPEAVLRPPRRREPHDDRHDPNRTRVDLGRPRLLVVAPSVSARFRICPRHACRLVSPIAHGLRGSEGPLSPRAWTLRARLLHLGCRAACRSSVRSALLCSQKAPAVFSQAPLSFPLAALPQCVMALILPSSCVQASFAHRPRPP